MVVKDRSVMESPIEYDRNLVCEESNVQIFEYNEGSLPMLRYCFCSAKDFFSFSPLEISETEALFEVSNFKLELKGERERILYQ